MGYFLIIVLKNFIAWQTTGASAVGFVQGVGTNIIWFMLLPVGGAFIFNFLAGVNREWMNKALAFISMLVIGVIIISFGSSLYFIGDLGVSTYDAVALILAEKKIARFQYCRIGSDLICTAVGYVLGATVGVGTVVTAFFMGPIIAFFNQYISIPLRYGRQKKDSLSEEHSISS